MTALIPFAFEEQLVRAVQRNDDPWFVGKDICLCLGLKNTNDAISSLDSDEKGVATTDPLGIGGEQTVVIVSEPGVYRLVFRSRKPEAERFKRWLAHEVLPQLRKTGRYAADALDDTGPDPAEGSLLHRLQLVREARALFGREVAKTMWRKLGLPAPPPPPATALDEARACLRHLLDSLVETGGGERERVRDLLGRALDDDEGARLMLLSCGIRAYPDTETFVIANVHTWLDRLMRDTDWSTSRVRMLRRLPDARAVPVTRFHAIVGPAQSRGTAFPAAALDDGA